MFQLFQRPTCPLLRDSSVNTYEIIPDFLMRYYKDFPNSYIVNKDFIHSGTLEYQKEQTNVLKELGFDIGNLL